MAISGTPIVIGNETIYIPTQGQDPSWSSGITAAFQAIAAQLLATQSSSDIPPSVSDVINGVTNQQLGTVSFNSANITSFSFNYGIYRRTDTNHIAETGYVEGVYDNEDDLWTLSHQFTGPTQSNGQPYHTFSMSGDNMLYTSVAIAGSNYDGYISYSAKTQLINPGT